jgi:hypothetical protein
VSAESHFERRLDTLIAKEIASGSVHWSDLLAKLPGVTPDVVVAALRRQGLLARVSFQTSKNRDPKTLPIAFRFWGEGRLPTPHLLDASWWFSDPALALLTERIKQSGAKQVVLLGTPTLWHSLREEDTGLASVTLVDGDSALRSCAIGRELVTCNLLGGDLPVRFRGDLVVSDPPWYEDEMRQFLVAAHECCRIGGKLLLSVPPEGTRPGIEQEWQSLLQWANELGFELNGYEESALLYLSPPFEHNAFLSAGIHSIPMEWRRGDLATFIRKKPGIKTTTPQPQRGMWIDYSIDGVRLRLRDPGSDQTAIIPDLGSLVDGGILPSVSKRHPLRDSVDLWSSGNRVFRCSHRLVMILILGAMEAHIDPSFVVEDKLHRNLCMDEKSRLACVVAKLQRVIEVEKCENLAFRGGYEQHLDFSPN